ncbi:MAG: hypothetical protein HC837_00060 [Chloroflexaceae bacterium]|nr:hypothetical protein [Chloroflexaceae bacterium]
MHVPLFSMRFWFYLALILQVTVIGYTAYYVRSAIQLVDQELQKQTRGKKRASKAASARATTAGSSQASTNGNVLPEHAEDEPMPVRSRRNARQKIKRKRKQH